MADEHALFHRLDVDVARFALDRALHDEIDQIDDRRRFAAFLQARDRFEHLFLWATREGRLAARRFFGAASATRRREGHLDCEVDDRLRSTNGKRLLGIADVDRIGDVAARGDDLLDAIAGLELEILDEAEEQRIGHRHGEEVLLQTDGDTHALLRNFFRDQNDGGRLGRILCEVDVRKAELEGERFRDLLFGRQVHTYKDNAHAFARTLVLR